MAKQDDYIRITARLPPEVHDALVEMANRTERSLNGELVARLQAAIKMAEAEARPQHHVAREKGARYGEDSAHELIELIESMSESKRRALLEVLKG